jgi:hypothetical protein
MAKISSSQRHSRHLLAAGGQLDFSHLLTEPKDSSAITTFDVRKEPRLTVRKGTRMDGWMACRKFEIFKIQLSSTVGHENSFKIVVYLLSDI